MAGPDRQDRQERLSALTPARSAPEERRVDETRCTLVFMPVTDSVSSAGSVFAARSQADEGAKFLQITGIRGEVIPQPR